MKVLLTFILSAFCLWNHATQAEVVHLLPTQDTYVRGGSFANDNYSTVTRSNGDIVANPEFTIKYSTGELNTRVTFIQFDLNQFGNAEISSAELWLTVRGNNKVNPVMDVSIVPDNSWNESTLTWNSKPAVGSLITSGIVPAKDNIMMLDLTNSVNEAIQAGETLWSIALTGGPDNAALKFASSNDTAGREVYLRIDANQVTSSPPITPGPTLGPTLAPATPQPTPEPTPVPTLGPTPVPSTLAPTPGPTSGPTPKQTTLTPTPGPTSGVPTPGPTPLPSPEPTPAPTPAPTPTSTPPPQEVTVMSQVLDDTFVRTNRDAIYGAFSSLTVSYGTVHDDRHPYIKVDISPAANSPIISEAKLELWVTTGDAAEMKVNVYPALSENWNQGSMNWNNQVWYDTANPIQLDLVIPADNTYMEIDLLAYVQAKATSGASTASIAILPVQIETSLPDGQKTKFASFENGATQPRFTLTYVPFSGPTPLPTPAPTPYPSLVSIDPITGLLVYENYANEINEGLGSVASPASLNTVPDFSNAGYKGGGVPIPFVPVKQTVSPMTGDALATIQAAIDAVSLLTPDSSGFRGAVLIEAGDYEISEPGLSVTSSGVVIRGQGSGVLGGTRITFTSTNRESNAISFGKTSGSVSLLGSKYDVADSFVPVGARSLSVTDASSFTVGDTIIIELQPNQDWLDHMSGMGQWGWTTSGYDVQWTRVITEIIGNEIFLNAPIVQAIEAVYGGAKVWRYSFSDQITNVGIEGIRFESIYANETDENHGKSAVKFVRVKDGWIRQVTALYFWYGAVSITTASSYITVEDSAMLEHKGAISGGRRYSFNIDGSDFLLMQRCLAKDGRHDFVSGSRTSGPNVFVDGRAIDSNSDSGPHHRFATGQLYDNIKVQGRTGPGLLRARNRGGSGSGHGWAGVQIMFWNTVAKIICDAPNGGMNWAVGNVGEIDPNNPIPEPMGIIQSLGTHVTPRSLYYTQLKERMGANALHSMVLPSQKIGPIWDDLSTWYGDGLFGDSVVLWFDEEAGSIVAGASVSIGAFVRDLNLLGSGSLIYTWSSSSGPGSVTFGNASAVDTTASFSTPGAYTINFQVSGSNQVETGSLVVNVV